jgi:hypothetical protein
VPLPLSACLQTKLSNPHYKPEIAAQTTLVNFCVTEKGLEDQLLALVVDHERPDLQVCCGACGEHSTGLLLFAASAVSCSCVFAAAWQHIHTSAQELKFCFAIACGCLQEQAASLIKALAQYTITLQELENSLLARLANAQVCAWFWCCKLGATQLSCLHACAGCCPMGFLVKPQLHCRRAAGCLICCVKRVDVQLAMSYASPSLCIPCAGRHPGGH